MDPPLEYLRELSESGLRRFEIARLNHAANLRKEMLHVMNNWLENVAEAMLARWLIENMERLRGIGDTPQEALDAESIQRTHAVLADDPRKGEFADSRRAGAIYDQFR